jgi:hypothetical protein
VGEVVGLNENAVLTHGEPDDDLIAALEDMLASARSGSLRAMAYAAISNERAISTSWRGHCDQHDMVAGVGMLQYRFLKSCGEVNEW